VTITRQTEERFRIVSGTAFVSNDLGWMTMHLPQDSSVTLSDVTQKWACLVLCGPQARKILAGITCDDVTDDAFSFMTAKFIHLAGVAVWAQRISYTGELGWELYPPWDQALTVWDALIAAGRDIGIRPIGYRALDALRIEKGFLYWSEDITAEDNPLEAGLAFTVDFNKADFIGRKALLKLRKAGLQTRLSALVLNAGHGLYGGESVYHGGEKLADRIRSAAFGHTIGKDIGLIYLPLDLAQPGTALEVEIFGRRIEARVAALPLVDPAGQKGTF
jgi:4-methylaminobutanoate oxidase (formaldehyde-forming)